MAAVTPTSRLRQRHGPLVIGMVFGFLLTGCMVGPDYERPPVQEPVHYKEQGGWLQVTPQSTQAPAEWWTIFADATLDQLEPRVANANQSLRAAYYAYQQSLALVDSARAGEFPTVGASVASFRSKNSTLSGSTPTTVTTDSVAITASWTLDFWGKVRRQVEANEAGAQASQDNLLAAQLSLQASLAQTYFQIRQLDGQIALARDTVNAYEKSLTLTQNRYAAGVVSKADVAQAQVQLANAKVQLVSFGVQRAQLEHAIAVLVGEPASDFTLPPMAELPPPQVISAGLPSQLLLRRPDLRAAERQVAAANAQIGVAEAAYFPSFSLTGQGGWRGSTFTNLISAPNEFWSFGPTLAATLFDGGARSAQVAQSKSAYQQVVAQYRQLSLQAFQQVEDQLAALRILADAAQLQQQAVAAAEDSLRLVTNAYKAGTASYLNVLVTQAALYNARNSALQLAGQRLTANVALIQALGGTWGDAAQAAATAAETSPPGSAEKTP